MTKTQIKALAAQLEAFKAELAENPKDVGVKNAIRDTEYKLNRLRNL